MRPQQRPEQRMQTVTIDEILALGDRLPGDRPALEHYFSPPRKEQFVRDYIRFLNSALLDVKHRALDQSLYVSFVLSFQFIAPLLEIPAEKELRLFYQVLEQRYDMDNLDLNLHFTRDGYAEGMVGEESVLKAFREELEASYTGKRDIRDRVMRRLKEDGIAAIMKWQQLKGIPQLAEAFGRAVVIPAFFEYTDKKLVNFYRSTSRGIRYEMAVPEFGEA